MKIENIDIQATIEKAHALIREDEKMSAGTKSIVEILILVITLLANRLNLNSTNSSRHQAIQTENVKRVRRPARKPGVKKAMWAPPLKRSITPIKPKR